MRRESLSGTPGAVRLAVVLAVFCAGVPTAWVSAQEKPNFTGAWMASELQAATSPEGGVPAISLGSGWGESFTLMQDSAVLTVERVLYRPRDYQPTLKLRYVLDGSESRNTFMMGRGMQVQESTARWEGESLVITMVHTVPDAEAGRTVRCEVTQTLSLEPPQQAVAEPSLIIETRRCGVLGGLPSTTRTVHNRH